MRRSLCALAAVVILAGTARADEADVVRFVEQIRGTVKRDDKQPGKPVVTVSLARTDVTDTELKALLKELKQLTTLNLEHCGAVTDASVKELKELKQLTTLNLRSAKVTDAGVKELQEALPKCKISR